ncbi:MAG TPA: maleylpyruvate isomerase family mycothiol-dependent enzyme [Nocardioidaceae bacterium]|nr:maleylpyruvate isomerase family mycothiol-dependent enzyme [Nocardioidaceae bacterium]
MDSETIWRHIDAERSSLADLLESLPQAAWDQPSLCQGWSVRDVGAHLTFSHARFRDVVRPAVRSGFRYNAMIRFAAVRSPLTHEQIVATLRSFVGSRRRAPFVTELEPLLDILVHSQDICVPLNIDHPMPVEAAIAAANRVLSLRGPMRLWEPPPGVRLVASDADWAHGDGVVHEAPIQSHLLTLTGRQPSSSGAPTATS